jgi:hypothetical protein
VDLYRPDRPENLTRSANSPPDIGDFTGHVTGSVRRGSPAGERETSLMRPIAAVATATGTQAGGTALPRRKYAGRFERMDPDG